MQATIQLVHRDHTIKAEPQAIDPDGGGFWKTSIEEPGGRCVYWDVEIITSIEGIVVNVMNEEHERILKEEAIEANEPTIADLQKQLAEIKEMLNQRAN